MLGPVGGAGKLTPDEVILSCLKADLHGIFNS